MLGGRAAAAVRGDLPAGAACPSCCRGERLVPGAGLRSETEWFGGPRKGTSELPRPDTDESEAGWRKWPLVTCSAASERYAIDKAIRRAETLCRFEFSVFVGTAEGDAAGVRRPACTTRWSRPSRSILIMVDPDRPAPSRSSPAATCAASLSDPRSTSSRWRCADFAVGDLVGGLKRGIEMLAEHARRPEHAARPAPEPGLPRREQGAHRHPRAGPWLSVSLGPWRRLAQPWASLACAARARTTSARPSRT